MSFQNLEQSKIDEVWSIGNIIIQTNTQQNWYLVTLKDHVFNYLPTFSTNLITHMNLRYADDNMWNFGTLWKNQYIKSIV